MNAPFCSWRGRYQRCFHNSCFEKANDSSVLQPLLKYNFNIRLLSFAVLSFRILTKLQCKLNRSAQGSSSHTQQGKYSYLHNLKVKKEGAQWAGIGQPLHEAYGWCAWDQAPERVWLLVRTYVHIHVYMWYVFFYIYAQKHIQQCQNIGLSSGSQPLVKLLLEQPIVWF